MRILKHLSILWTVMMAFKSWGLESGTYKMMTSKEGESVFAMLEKIPGAPHSYHLALLQLHEDSDLSKVAFGNSYYLEEKRVGVFKLKSYGQTQDYTFCARKANSDMSAVGPEKELLQDDLSFSVNQTTEVGSLQVVDQKTISLSLSHDEGNEIVEESSLKNLNGLFKKDKSLKLIGWRNGQYVAQSILKEEMNVVFFDRQMQSGNIQVEGMSFYDSYSTEGFYKPQNYQVKAKRVADKFYLFSSQIQDRKSDGERLSYSCMGTYPLIFVKKLNKIFSDDYYVINTRENRLYKEK